MLCVSYQNANYILSPTLSKEVSSDWSFLKHCIMSQGDAKGLYNTIIPFILSYCHLKQYTETQEGEECGETFTFHIKHRA